MEKEEGSTYHVRLLFQGDGVEKLLRVMAHYRLPHAKDLFYRLLDKEYQEIVTKEE